MILYSLRINGALPLILVVLFSRYRIRPASGRCLLYRLVLGVELLLERWYVIRHNVSNLSIVHGVKLVHLCL